MGVMRRAVGESDPERARILATGRPAHATIVDVRPLGLEVSAGPVPTRLVEVDIDIDGATGYPITVRDAISELHVGRLLKGMRVPVRVDPVDPKRVVVMWDAL
jgi:hypothetical protein